MMPKNTAYADSSRDDILYSLISDIADVLCSSVKMPEKEATEVAKTVVTGLQERIGGASLYLPAPDKAERDAEIRKAFDGTNLEQVKKRFGVSSSTVYLACRRQRGGGFVVKGRKG